MGSSTVSMMAPDGTLQAGATPLSAAAAAPLTAEEQLEQESAALEALNQQAGHLRGGFGNLTWSAGSGTTRGGMGVAMGGRGRGGGPGGRGDGAGAGRGFAPGRGARGVPPPYYVCKRCNIAGHYIQECPTNGDAAYDIQVRETLGYGMGCVFAISISCLWVSSSPLFHSHISRELPLAQRRASIRIVSRRRRKAATIRCVESTA